MITVSTISTDDDIDLLVAEINQASWDHTNDMATFDAVSLSVYLERKDTLFVACHELTDVGRIIMGIASARLQMKPYDQALWLYVDEVDVCVDQRGNGAGKAIMRTLLQVASNAGCEEVWLGTEPDNNAANALYRSMSPDEVESFIGYNYEI